MDNEILSVDRLREVLAYDPQTGYFWRKIRTAQRHHVGDRADFLVTSGSVKGYYRVSLDSQRYLAHRLAWFYVHGAWPVHGIDHFDTDPGNNRIGNLRDVPELMNLQNKRRARSDNRCGFLGVTTHAPGVYRASVHVGGNRIHIGLFDTPEKAHAAYVAAKRIHHEGCTL